MNMAKSVSAAVIGCFLLSQAASAATVLVEAESFEDTGGWVIDQQFVDQMGSPYLLAHGYGRPVSDAQTRVQIPAPGKYRVLVRTQNWVAKFDAPGAPGKFQLLVDGKPLATTFGTEGAKWYWQHGGTISVNSRSINLTLHDLTGFEGRCDAIVLTTDQDFTPPSEGRAMADFRRKMLGISDGPEDAGRFDLVVVGGGMSGICAAVSAARCGLDVALVQNRPVLGGNNSSEVRVHLGGKINLPPYPRIGDVVNELDPGYHGNARPAQFYDDDKKLRIVLGEPNIKLFLNTHVNRAEMQGKRIKSVTGLDIRSGKELRFEARYFADCTGDGCVGYLAGADFRIGRESKDQTKESMAPEEPDMLTMGTSIMWYSHDAGRPVDFPECPWALQFTEQSCQNATRGEWNWETGLGLHQVDQAEYIRDHAFRAIYGNWAFQKNHSKDKARYADRKLDWVAYIGGKRESRRLMGDVILQQQDIQERKRFPDAMVTTTWSIDLHYPDPKNSKHFPGREFRTICTQPHIKPYPIPYRCLYSRNIDNLFMAGRNISVTHVALGTVRVMRTCGMMGEVVGMAASVAAKKGLTPRGVYEKALDDLIAIAEKGVGKKITVDDNTWQKALQNGRLANEGFIRCRRFIDGWLAHADAKTGLIPRNLNRDKDIWNAQDSAADNYPFMVLTAALTDPALYNGRMRQMLETEKKLTSRIGNMPDTYSFSKQGFANDEPDLNRIIFGSSEYIKDGLLPLTERIGRGPWYDRMIAILDDIWKHAPVDTPYGKIVSTNEEINGEMLQTLSRLCWMTGDVKYLDYAIRLGDYYLLGDHHPTRPKGPARGQWLLLDLGDKHNIASAKIAWIYGDRRQYAFEVQTSTDKKNWTQVFEGKSSGKTADMRLFPLEQSAARYVRITGFGNNENDWTNIAELTLHTPDGEKVNIENAVASGHQNPNKPSNAIDGDMSTRWSVGGSSSTPRLRLRDHGCEIVSGLCELYAAIHFARPEKKARYEKPIHDMLDRILECGVNEHGLFYNWMDPVSGAHDSRLTDTWGYNLNGFYTVYLIDGNEAYRDAVVKALSNLWPHYSKKDYKWGGSDDYADSVEGAINLYNREPVPSVPRWIDSEIRVMWDIQKPDGVIEGWHGDGNFARTTLMYCLWKTKSLDIKPWREDVIFGAELIGNALAITITAEKPWEGKIQFHSERHKTLMNLPLDWPRINQFPEWFAVREQLNYKITDTDANTARAATGKDLLKGYPITLKPNQTKHLLVE